jgi:DNA repair exonuclease SbcCD ATPase subunit
MKIRLKNFRCYEDETFDFGSNGLALLSGASGKGKTTILMGIHFALFGTGTKVVSYGKTSCMVELHFEDLKIVRTKRPNRLIVNDIYEDASGQEIINKKFGDTFKTCGYIQQNNLDSFVLMSPIEKLSFLEKFAFRDIDLPKIKARCKAHINKMNDELISVTSQLDMARQVLEEMDIPNEVRFPLKVKPNNREKAITNEKIRYKNCTILVKRAEKVKAKLEKELNELRVFRANTESREETVKKLKRRIEQLETSLDTDYLSENEGITSTRLADLGRRLKSCIANKELQSLSTELENNRVMLEKMRVDEIENLTKQLETLNNEILEYKENNFDEELSEYETYLQDAKKLETLMSKMESNFIDLDTHEAKKKALTIQQEELERLSLMCSKMTQLQQLYTCPSCNAHLRLKNNTLVKENVELIEDTELELDTLKKQIKILSLKTKELQNVISVEEDKLVKFMKYKEEIKLISDQYDDIPTSDNIREYIQELKQSKKRYCQLQREISTLRQKLEDEDFSGSYNSFKLRVDKLEEKVTKLKLNNSDNRADTENMSEDKLREEITRIKECLFEKQNLENRLLEAKNELDSVNDTLLDLRQKYEEKHGVIRLEDEILENIEEQNTAINTTEKLKIKHEKNIEQIESWKKYQEELEKYNIWEEKISKLEETEKKTRNEYAAATRLKDKILEAESIAVLNVIDSINTHARVYLDAFFTTNPISVQLQPFKESKVKKTTKPQITMVIEYKGMEADLTMLSGGELSRVILAYTLALAEMFNTPLLMLDECTASLDQELTSSVFDAIKDNFNGSLTVIIAHQVVTGMFDKIVNLDGEEK